MRLVHASVCLFGALLVSFSRPCRALFVLPCTLLLFPCNFLLVRLQHCPPPRPDPDARIPRAEEWLEGIMDESNNNDMMHSNMDFMVWQNKGAPSNGPSAAWGGSKQGHQGGPSPSKRQGSMDAE